MFIPTIYLFIEICPTQMEESLKRKIQFTDPGNDRVQANNVQLWKPSNDGSTITVVLEKADQPDAIDLTPKGGAPIPEIINDLRVRLQYKENADSPFKPDPREVSLDAAL